MTPRTVLHLVDDTTPGGVMRVLDHIRSAPQMAGHVRHVVRPVTRNAWSYGRFDACLIVSHLALSWRTLPALVALRAYHPNQPIVHVEHSYTEAFVALNVPNRARFAAMLKTSCALFDRVVAVSATQGKWLTSRGLVAPEALRVITSAVDLRAPRALPRPAGRPTVIGAIGRLHRQKGFDVLIEAFRGLDLPDVRLDIYGEGAERAALESLAAGDPRITLKGYVNDPCVALSAVDAVAMPSRWEAFGLVATEAKAAGRPILISGIDGLRDQAGPGAIVVNGLEPTAWRAALADLCQTDKPERAPRNFAPEADFHAAWNALVSEFLPSVQQTPAAQMPANQAALP